MKTLVTGATGFLGSHVARQLAGRGEDLRVLVRPASDVRALEGIEAERVTGDLRDPASLERAMVGVARVFHVAADYRLWAREHRCNDRCPASWQAAERNNAVVNW
jgi:dihydroflavonol-4-reductase